MTSLPDHDALVDSIVRVQRNKKSSKSTRASLTPPRIDLRQQRYPVLPTITKQWYVLILQYIKCYPPAYSSNDEVSTHQCATPQPATQQDPSHNVLPVPPVAVTSGNIMPAGSVPFLPILLPWQHAQVPHTNIFDAQHNITGTIHSRTLTKKEPWFKKFKYRYFITA